MVEIENVHKLVGARQGETIIKVLHRHWFDIASHLFMAAFFAILLAFGFFLLPALFPAAFTGENGLIALLIENTFLLLLFIFVFLVWIDVWFDVWIITNERIINIEQKGLFVRHISEVSFSKVQDVTSETNGLIQSVLDFGEVYVQSASEIPRFLFRSIPDPVAVKDLVMRLSQGAKEDDLEDAVGILEDMHRRRRA
jgi:hypothetical protein